MFYVLKIATIATFFVLNIAPVATFNISILLIKMHCRNKWDLIERILCLKTPKLSQLDSSITECQKRFGKNLLLESLILRNFWRLCLGHQQYIKFVPLYFGSHQNRKPGDIWKSPPPPTHFIEVAV